MQRQLPSADLAEQSLLATIFFEPDLMVTAADLLQPDDFFIKSNAAIFTAMKSLHESHHEIDFVSVGEFFSQNPSLGQVPLEYISYLSQLSPSSEGFETYLNLILDASLKRKIIKVSSDIVESGYRQSQSAEEYLESVEKQVYDLSTSRPTSDFEHVSKVAEQYYDKMEAISKAGHKVTGLNTGFSSLNDVTTGFQPEELIIVAARPGMGKSAFAINLALNIAKPNSKGETKHVALFSLEMSNEQIVGRMLSNLSGIDNMKLRRASLKTDEWRDLGATIQSLKNYGIHFNDSMASKVGELRAKCRRYKNEGKLDLIIIDYLQLLSPSTSRYANRQEVVSEISRSLKQLAKELKVPIIALSQLSRNVEQRKGDDRKPVLSDLRESGSIEQDADIVIFLHSDDYYIKDGSEPTGLIDVIIAKNRQGMSGIELKFRFARQQSRFYQVEQRES
ncbi:MAG: replicative DNA helicase [Acholeplasmataceae bacterium]